LDEAGQLVILGGSDGIAGVYSIPENTVQQSFKVGSAVTSAVWYGSQPVVSTSSGSVKVFGDNETTFKSHAGSANGLALHPCGEILASVGVDKSFVFYDLVGKKAVTQVYTDSGMPPKCGYLSLMLMVSQSLLLLPSIQTGIYLPLEGQMVK